MKSKKIKALKPAIWPPSQHPVTVPDICKRLEKIGSNKSGTQLLELIDRMSIICQKSLTPEFEKKRRMWSMGIAFNITPTSPRLYGYITEGKQSGTGTKSDLRDGFNVVFGSWAEREIAAAKEQEGAE